MQTSNINTEIMNLNMVLDSHKREVNAKDIAKTESKNSKDKTTGKFGAEKESPVRDPNAAPIMGNMFFQVCGGMQSTLAALEGVIFENEGKLMASGTKLAQLNSTAQGTAAVNAYTASVASGQIQEQTMRLNADQSFTTATITLASGVGTIAGDKFSGSGKEMDKLKTKLSQQQKVSDLVRPDAENPLGNIEVADDDTLNGETKPANPAVQARAKDLASGSPFKGFNEEHFPQEAAKYNSQEGSYYVERLDEAAVKQMQPEEKIVAYKAIEDQIKTTKMEINTAETRMANTRQMIQSASQFGTQIVQGTIATLQAPLSLAKNTQDAVATMENNAASTSNANVALAAKMRDLAVEEGKNTVAALIQAMNVRA